MTPEELSEKGIKIYIDESKGKRFRVEISSEYLCSVDETYNEVIGKSIIFNYYRIYYSFNNDNELLGMKLEMSMSTIASASATPTSSYTYSFAY